MSVAMRVMSGPWVMGGRLRVWGACGKGQRFGLGRSIGGVLGGRVWMEKETSL